MYFEIPTFTSSTNNTFTSLSPHLQIPTFSSSVRRNSTCALCDARSIRNKSCEILCASKLLEPGQTLKVRVLNDVEFASMNRIKLIAC